MNNICTSSGFCKWDSEREKKVTRRDENRQKEPKRLTLRCLYSNEWDPFNFWKRQLHFTQINGHFIHLLWSVDDYCVWAHFLWLDRLILSLLLAHLSVIVIALNKRKAVKKGINEWIEGRWKARKTCSSMMALNNSRILRALPPFFFAALLLDSKKTHATKL